MRSMNPARKRIKQFPNGQTAEHVKAAVLIASMLAAALLRR
ncbi:MULTISPECIES: hypothetical protein [Streptomyces]|nr:MULTISPECIES: hypothetical protein [Streptomyces]